MNGERQVRSAIGREAEARRFVSPAVASFDLTPSRASLRSIRLTTVTKVASSTRRRRRKRRSSRPRPLSFFYATSIARRSKIFPTTNSSTCGSITSSGICRGRLRFVLPNFKPNATERRRDDDQSGICRRRLPSRVYPSRRLQLRLLRRRTQRERENDYSPTEVKIGRAHV